MNPAVPRTNRSMTADLLLAGLIVAVVVLNVRPVHTGRIAEEARWQHGWPLPCLWRHRAVERLERRFGWLSRKWPVRGAPSGSFYAHRGAFLIDAAIALVMIAATALVTSRLLRGKANPRRLGLSTPFWLAGMAAAVWLLAQLDRPGVELAMTGFVCFGAACVLHAAFLLLNGLGRS